MADLASLQPPLYARTASPAMIPALGMSGSKLQDLFVDAKIPRELRVEYSVLLTARDCCRYRHQARSGPGHRSDRAGFANCCEKVSTGDLVVKT